MGCHFEQAIVPGRTGRCGRVKRYTIYPGRNASSSRGRKRGVEHGAELLDQIGALAVVVHVVEVIPHELEQPVPFNGRAVHLRDEYERQRSVSDLAGRYQLLTHLLQFAGGCVT